MKMNGDDYKFGLVVTEIKVWLGNRRYNLNFELNFNLNPDATQKDGGRFSKIGIMSQTTAAISSRLFCI